MRRLTKTPFLILTITAILLAANPFSSYAESKELSEQEFAKVCEENHAEQSRRLHPPLKDPASDPFNYGFHYREVLLSSDRKSFVDNPHDMKGYRNLAAGQIIMDMEDGYEISYEYQIQGVNAEDTEKYVVEGGTITPYYRAIPLSSVSGSEKQYTYISNETKELPVIPDFPKDYDWKGHQEHALQVSVHVTVRSVNDGSTYSYYSRLSSVTNLYKDEPDCYFLTPTDLQGYTIQKGDSLRKIAEKYYGNSDEWIYILERNKDCISDADMIQPDMFIVIPNAKAVR